MSDNLAIPTLEQLALHQIAEKYWNILVFQHAMEMSVRLEYVFECVFEHLPEVLPMRFPKLLKDKFVDAMINLREGCNQACCWLLNHNSIILLSEGWQEVENLYLKCKNILFSEKSKYKAIHFIGSSGHFDDLSWAKLFVADEEQSLKSRFYLACIYCLEEEIHTLWNTKKTNNQSFCEDDFYEATFNTGTHLVVMWISRLEHKIQNNFNVNGFNEAALHHHEYAAKFFWRHCSMNERARILSELDFYQVAYAVEDNRVGFVHFIYSLLPVEKKIRLLSNQRNKSIWACFLRSCYYKSILNDIHLFFQHIPIQFYANLLCEFAVLIRNSSILQHKVVFLTLWNCLSQNEINEVLQVDYFNIPLHLSNGNCIHLFETIILPLPRSVKDREILSYSCDDFYMQFSFFSENALESYLRYLLLFFLECGNTTQKLTVRSDAANLLDRMVDKYVVKAEMNIPPFKKYMFNIVMECFRETLPAIEELISQTDYALVPHYFLSREIYPLLSIKGKIILNHKREGGHKYRL